MRESDGRGGCTGDLDGDRLRTGQCGCRDDGNPPFRLLGDAMLCRRACADLVGDHEADLGGPALPTSVAFGAEHGKRPRASLRQEAAAGSFTTAALDTCVLSPYRGCVEGIPRDASIGTCGSSRRSSELCYRRRPYSGCRGSLVWRVREGAVLEGALMKRLIKRMRVVFVVAMSAGGRVLRSNAQAWPTYSYLVW